MARRFVEPSYEWAMSAEFQHVLLLLPGFIGMGAIGLLPYRSLRLMQLLLEKRQQRTAKVFIALALVIVGVTLWAYFELVSRIHTCLIGPYCGPSLGSGWIYSSMLGGVYLAFELIGYLIQWAHRAVSSNDPIGKAVSTGPGFPHQPGQTS